MLHGTRLNAIVGASWGTERSNHDVVTTDKRAQLVFVTCVLVWYRSCLVCNVMVILRARDVLVVVHEQFVPFIFIVVW